MGHLLRLCTLLAIFVGCPSQGEAASVGPDLSYYVAGLAKPVDIMIDPWGVPHAFAGTIEDAFFAQGFMTAKDRLWQIDLAHRRRLGRLSAVLGPTFVPFDQAARLFLGRRDPDVIWAAVGPQIHGITRAYVAGINAFIAATVTQPDLPPPQYALVGYSPEPWNADDMVRIQQLSGSDAIDRQFRRAGMACRGLLPTDALRALACFFHARVVEWHHRILGDAAQCALGWDHDRMRPKTWQGIVGRASLKNQRLGFELRSPWARDYFRSGSSASI